LAAGPVLVSEPRRKECLRPVSFTPPRTPSDDTLSVRGTARKRPGIPPFLTTGCSPRLARMDSKTLSESPAFSVAVHLAHSVPVRIAFTHQADSDQPPTLGSNFLLAGRDALTNRRRSPDPCSIVWSSRLSALAGPARLAPRSPCIIARLPRPWPLNKDMVPATKHLECAHYRNHCGYGST
jgi:hypothetical protein